MCVAIVLRSYHASGVGSIEYGSKYLHLCDSDNSQVLPYLKSAPIPCIVRSHGDGTMTVNYVTDFFGHVLGHSYVRTVIWGAQDAWSNAPKL